MKLSQKWIIPVLLIITLLLAAYLRLYRIEDYLTFLGDEGRDVLRVKQMLVDGDLIFLGPTASVGGFFLGPMYYYFMTPFLWLWNYNPVGPAVMVALFGIATVYLVYYVGRKWFHPVVGITAAFLYALSPVVIAYSRSSWNPNLVPFFSLLLMFMLWRAALYKNMRDYFYIGLLWGLGIQFHYLFSFVIIISILWLMSMARRKEWVKSYAVTLLGSLITFSPFILFEIKHGFPNLRAMITFIFAGNETGFSGQGFFETIGDVLFRSFGRLVFRMPNYDVWSSFSDWHINILIMLIRTVILISGVILVVFILSKYKNKHPLLARLSQVVVLTREQHTASVLLLLWYGLSIVLFGFYKRGIYDYYFGIFYAAPFLALGIIFWQLAQKRLLGLLLASSMFIGLAYYNWQGRPFVYEPNKQLEQTRIIASAAIEMTDNKPYNFALLTATNSDHAYRYFFEIWNKKPTKLENLEIDPNRTSVTEQLIIICENPSCKPLGDSLWEIAGFGRAEIAQEKYVFPVQIFKLIHYKEEE